MDINASQKKMLPILYPASNAIPISFLPSIRKRHCFLRSRGFSSASKLFTLGF
jgi:hypothetical protein